MMPDPRKILRFPELYRRKGPLIVCPIDDSLITGPRNGLERPYAKLRSMIDGGPTAILTFSGMIERCVDDFIGIRTIVNLSASTFRSSYTRKVLLGSIDTAMSYSAASVAVHVNLSSEYAPEMLASAGEIIEQARRCGMPTTGIMYPRGERNGETEEFLDLKDQDRAAYAELVGHCVQVGVDLGFDLIKTQYTGDPESFARVIEVSGGTPVIIAGGPMIEEAAAIKNAVDAVGAGAAGISFARNVFGRDDPSSFLRNVREALRPAER